MKKIIPLILSTLLLTSCSGPDSSGGVEFSKTDNSFPYGDCRGPGYQTHSTERTGCGYFVSQNANPENSYYIMSNGNLSGANLIAANLNDATLGGANLTNANLVNANLSGANLATGSGMGPVLLSGAYWGSVKADSTTTCPNGIKWGTSGNDCPF